MRRTPQAEKRRGLVVDHDPQTRTLLARWLTDAGYACSVAADAHAAWLQLQRQNIDLVIMDVRLPGRSGLDLLKQIQQPFPEVAVLMLTGAADSASAIEALAAGAYGYLQKPIARTELLIQASKALEQRRTAREQRDRTDALAAQVRDQTAEIIAAHEATIHLLVRASLYRDEESAAHVRRTGEYSELLALRAGWNVENARLIRLAAPLHDIGKIGLPDSVLRKTDRLTSQETCVMQSHTVIGAQLLAGSELPMLQLAHEIALHHHEHWDGSGYPQGLSGHAIPESARIVAIVDLYDALSHDRIYRPALPASLVQTALEERRGRHFDPMLLDAFLSLLPDIRQMHDSNLNHGQGLTG